MKKLRILSFWVFLGSISIIAEQAIIITPVTDCVGARIRHFNLGKTTTESYKMLPLCGAATSSQGCPRIQQLLFNEPVDIIKKQGAEVCVQVEHFSYVTHTNKTPQNMYWLQVKHVVPLSKLQEYEIPLDKLPLTNHHILALLYPWYDPVTQKTYSAGTFFVYDPALSTPETSMVYILDWPHKQLMVSSIPQEYVFIIPPDNTKHMARKKFIEILRLWTRMPGYIAYVWGGSSLITLCKENSFSESPQITRTNKRNSVYTRTECNTVPKTGFDCAGIVARAAQLAGLPYYYKNTYTLAHYLTPLQPQQRIKEGDLIWIPGHVMVVSSLEKNLLIEARGYSHGFGIVQEIELAKVFKGIYTYQALLNAYHNHHPLERFNIHGVPVETISTFKILSLDSVWDKQI